MIVHIVLSFITEKPYATLQHIVHIFYHGHHSGFKVIWLTILIPIICKYQIWFVKLFVGKKMIHKWSQNIFIHVTWGRNWHLNIIHCIMTVLSTHSLFPFYHTQQETEHLIFRVMLNMFRLKIWHLHLVFIPAISCTPWHLVFKIVTSHLLEQITQYNVLWMLWEVKWVSHLYVTI